VNVPIGLAVWLLGRVAIVETERRHGRFDVVGALTSTLGMGAVVLGLVEAGTNGWTGPVTLTSFAVGLALLGLFVHNESRVEEPVLPLRLLANATRSAANAGRGLLYAGMYGMFFFMSLFFQDVQHYSPLRAGLAFLPLPASVFLSSQLTSRVLTVRFPQKAVMMSGIGLAMLSLLLATRIEATSSYGQIVVSLVLLGMGSGISFVSLTSAALADVEPDDAGAASGLINVAQQIGAALGLAVLVTAFGVATHHAQIAARVNASSLAHADAVLVHGLHTVFGMGAVFTLAALVIVASAVRRAPAPITSIEPDVELGEDDMAWLAECPAAEVG
jgi:MFS family permease